MVVERDAAAAGPGAGGPTSRTLVTTRRPPSTRWPSMTWSPGRSFDTPGRASSSTASTAFLPSARMVIVRPEGSTRTTSAFMNVGTVGSELPGV